MANISDAYGEWRIELLEGSKTTLEEILVMIEDFNKLANSDGLYGTYFEDGEIKDGKLTGIFRAEGKWSVETNFKWLTTLDSYLKVWKKYPKVRGFKLIITFEELEPANWFFVDNESVEFIFEENSDIPKIVSIEYNSMEPTKEVLRASRWFSEDVDWVFYDAETGEPYEYNDIIELDDDDRPRAIYVNLVRSGKYKNIVGDVELKDISKESYEKLIKERPEMIDILLNLLEEAREVHKKYIIELEQELERKREEWKKIHEKNTKQQ